MRSRKSQTTVFIMIGVVMLMMFGLLYAVMVSRIESSGRPNLNQVTSAILDAANVRSYVSGCLDSVSSEAIEMMGYQGGYIYSYQIEGGMFFDQNLIVQYYSPETGRHYNQTVMMYDEDNFNYADNARRGKLVYPPHLAQYPYGLQNSRIPTFANIPTLCAGNGTNYITSGSERSCETFDSYYSIQHVLERYISRETLQCIDLSHFLLERGLNISYQHANVSIFLGENNVNVMMNMTVKVDLIDESCTQDCGRVETRLDNFVVNLPVRLKQVHELAWHILERDASDIFFNLNSIKPNYLNDCRIYNGTDNSRNTTGPCLKEGMKAQYIKNQSSRYGFIVIEDTFSPLNNNNNFKFIMAIDNRKPHVDKISYHDYSEAYHNYLKNIYNLEPEMIYNNSRYPADPVYDIIVEVGKPLIIIPYAIDPDEDYSSDNVTFMEKIYTYQSTTLSHVFNITHFPGTPNLGKDISYTTTNNEIGKHIIKVIATDSQGKSHSREIKVWIRCVDTHPGDYERGYLPLDKNQTNDCCDEATGELHKSWQKCGQCMKCNNQGNCVWNITTESSDCGPCAQCVLASGGCITNDAYGNSLGNCPAPSLCCGGGCKTATPLNSFQINWVNCIYNYNAIIVGWGNTKHSGCWRSTYECIPMDFDSRFECLRGYVTRRPLLGPNEPPANSALCTQTCTNGRCVG